MLIDSHFHVFTAETPLKSDLWRHRELPAPIEDLLENFRQYNVESGVISTSSQYGLYKDYFAAALAEHDNLRATVNLDLATTASDLADLSAQGFVGTRLLWRPLADAPDPNSDEYQRLFKLCADADWHVHITDHPDRYDHTIRAIEAAGARVIVDHMGLIDASDVVNHPGFKAILEAVERGQTWVKLGGGFRLKQADPDAAAAALIAVGGHERLMWGSDWPFVGHQGKFTYARSVAALDQWVPDAEMRAKVGYQTAKKFFFAD